MRPEGSRSGRPSHSRGSGRGSQGRPHRGHPGRAATTSGRSTGTRPRGPHYAPLLERNYDTTDFSVEAYQTYALCYKCHNRDFLINDRTGTFPQRKHVVDGRAPCAACHDAHGSRQNVGLINFMFQDLTGRTVASASQVQHRLEFVSLGRVRGQCFLSCHGRNHEGDRYPARR